MNKIIQQVLTLATLCWVLTGCSGENLLQEYEEGRGYLCLTLGSVDVELSSTTRAEAGFLPEDLIPEVEDFMIDIQMGKESVEGFPKKYSELTAGVELMAGGYTVIAYHGENKPIQDTPYFSGSSTVQIYPGETASTTINATLANAMLMPDVTENLKNHYTDWTLTVKAGDASMTLANKEESDGYLFAQAGQSVNAVFEGTNLLGNETSHEWTVVSPAVAQTKYVIQCDPDIPIFSFELNAVAEHTANQSGYVNGTKVSLSFGDLSNVPLTLITNWKATLVNEAGEVVRSYSTSDFSSTGEMAIENNWPYLPQGNYTLKYSYTIDGNEVNEEATANEAKTVTMPLPTFNAEVSAQTSYSVFQSQGTAAANETDGSGIFNISLTTNIAPDILGNEKYADLLNATYSLDSGESSTEKSPVFQNLQWGKRTLTASASFDGSNSTSSVECEVTGIPYYISFNGNTNPENWTLSNNGKCGDRLVLKRGDAYALSPKFYTPSDVNVNVTLNAYAYGGSWPYNYKPTVSIHPSEVGQNSTVITTLSGSIEVPGTATFQNISTTFMLTDIVGKVCIYTTGNGSGAAIGIGDMGVVCDHFSIQYK